MKLLGVEAEGSGIAGQAATVRNMLRFGVPMLAVGLLVSWLGHEARVFAVLFFVFPASLMLASAFFHWVAVVAARLSGSVLVGFQVATGAGAVALLLWFFSRRASPLVDVLPYAVMSAWDVGALALCAFVAFHLTREIGADPPVRAYLAAVGAVFFLAVFSRYDLRGASEEERGSASYVAEEPTLPPRDLALLNAARYSAASFVGVTVGLRARRKRLVG